MIDKQSELKADPNARTSDIVAQLKRLHDAGQGGSEALPPRDETPVAKALAPALAPPGDYDALQRRIAAIEAHLRAHKDRVAQLVEASTPEQRRPVATQATLYLQCPRGGQTGGRFVCRNHFDHPATLSTQVLEFVDTQGRPVDGVSLTLTGTEKPLAAQEARTIRCRIDLSACGPLPQGPLEGAVDLTFEGAACLRLWIEVDVHD